MIWFWFRECILAAAALPLLLFIVYYNRYSPRWKGTFQGRALMAQDVAMLLVLTNSITSLAFDYPAERVIGSVLFTVLLILFWVMFIALRLAQSNARDIDRAKEGKKESD
jgi:hypothetical protein